MLYRKGPGMEAKLCFIGHALMENRYGLFVDAWLTQVYGHAERIAALDMIEPRADRPRAITLGADKGYDAEDFVNELRAMNATPHVAQNTSGRSRPSTGAPRATPATRSASAFASGSRKPSAGSRPSPARKTKFRGRERVGWAFTFAAAAYNLVRLPKLMASPA